VKSSRSLPSFVARHLAEVPRSGIRDFFEIVSARRDVISLGIGEPDFVSPWHICEASVFALERGATSYTANLGLIELREALAEYARQAFRAQYDPECEILVTVGVSEALDLAVRAITEPGDEILYHEPSFVSYAPVISFAHGIAVPVATHPHSGFRLRREDLESAVSERSKALILNYPTNPTGAVLPREDVEQVAAFATEHDLLVISDEIYSELTYEGEHFSIASLPGMKERTVLLSGFSKAWAMTGFRIGFACSTPELTEAMMKIHQYTMMCAPVLAQKAALEALRSGNEDINYMRGEYEKRRNFICAAFKEMGVPCDVPQGAFYAFPCIGDFGLSSQDFSLKLLDEENVACVPGTAFGPSGEGYLRCAFAAHLDDIKTAMQRMRRFVQKL
jgi:aminotransferase